MDFEEFFHLESTGVFECILYACANIQHALSLVNFEPSIQDLESLLREFRYSCNMAWLLTALYPNLHY
jgi:hypothetical protein